MTIDITGVAVCEIRLSLLNDVLVGFIGIWISDFFWLAGVSLTTTWQSSESASII